MSNVDKKTNEGETPVKLCNFVDVYRNWAITKDLIPTLMSATAKPQEIEKFTLSKGQVALTKDSETRDDIGIATYIADNMDNVLLGYHCAVLTPNSALVDSKYLNAYMHSNIVHKYFENNASGSGQRYTLSYDALLNIPVLLPDLELQKGIGQIFSNIDRKITLNRQINDNLEATARQLYDYWFVQFDFPDENGRPYKSSGGKMILNKDLHLCVPEKWDVCELHDFILDNNTGDWGYDSKSDEHPIEVTCIRGADIIRLINLPQRYIKTRNASKFLHPWNIVIEVSGGSPIQATGRCALITPGVLKRNGGKVTCSNFCHAFTMQEDFYSAYFYYTWKVLYDNNNMFNYEGKTSGIKNFMTSMFLANKWVRVPQDLMMSFYEKVKVIYKEIDNNIEEISSLSKQRNELLPLLMNGQATVNYHLSDD